MKGICCITAVASPPSPPSNYTMLFSEREALILLRSAKLRKRSANLLGIRHESAYFSAPPFTPSVAGERVFTFRFGDTTPTLARGLLLEVKL